MQTNQITCLCLAAVIATIAGCGSTQADPTSSDTQVDGSKYLLAAEPDGVQNVKDFLQDAQDGDDVVVVGRVGGEVNPWIEGLAAFNIADLSLVACDDCEGDKCPTPWDYCCESDLPKGRTLVQVVDGNGKVVANGAKELLKIKELQTVVIQGRASRDEAGNVSLLAAGVYVRP
jgi:hypothetical protein